MSFADAVKAAITNAEKEADTEPGRRYRAVLDELAEGLSELGVGARIDTRKHDPRRLSLYLYPPYRPQRGSNMLTFFLDGGAIFVSGEVPKRLESPEELEKWLLDFVKLPALVESIQTLREQASWPVEARLRVSASVAYSKEDVLVAVGPADQQKIAEAALGSRLEFEVERINFPGNAQFASNSSYTVLDSAGIVMNVQSVTPSGERLKIIGNRA